MKWLSLQRLIATGSALLLAVAAVPALGDFIPLPVKWSQPITVGGIPHKGPGPVPAGAVIDGTDWMSDHTIDIVRADDFISDGRPIVGVRWWGSYLNDLTGIIRPTGFTGPFDISFHLSNANPGGTGVHPFSLPEPTPLVIQTVSAQEEFVGFDVTGHAVYRYDTLLDPPFPEQKGVEYFLDIDKPTQERWGWHETGLQFLDFSAFAPTHFGPWASTGNAAAPGFDLAFELLTIPEPASLGVAVMALVWLVPRRR